MQSSGDANNFDWNWYEASLGDMSEEVDQWTLEVQLGVEEIVSAKLFSFGIELPLPIGDSQTLNDIRVEIQSRITALTERDIPGVPPTLPSMAQRAHLDRQSELCYLAEEMANVYAHNSNPDATDINALKQKVELDIIDSQIISAEEKAKFYASLDQLVPLGGLTLASVDDIHEMREEADADPLPIGKDTKNIRDFLAELFFRENYEKNGGYETFLDNLYNFIYVVRTTDDIERWREAKDGLVASGLAAGVPSNEVVPIAGFAAKLVECDPAGL